MPLASDLSLSIAALYKLRIYLRIKNVPFMILLQIEKHLNPAHVSCLIIAAHQGLSKLQQYTDAETQAQSSGWVNGSVELIPQ